MTEQNEVVSSDKILKEIIETANELPLEAQEKLLNILLDMSKKKKYLTDVSEKPINFKDSIH